MEKMMVYGVVLPAETARRMRVAAAAQGLSRSRLIRDLVETYLAQFELDPAVHLQVSVEGLPGEDGLSCEADRPGRAAGQE